VLTPCRGDNLDETKRRTNLAGALEVASATIAGNASKRHRAPAPSGALHPAALVLAWPKAPQQERDDAEEYDDGD
jgi:hypothetical protein